MPSSGRSRPWWDRLFCWLKGSVKEGPPSHCPSCIGDGEVYCPHVRVAKLLTHSEERVRWREKKEE